MTHVIVDRSWSTSSGLLRQVGERDDPVILPTGRGDEAATAAAPMFATRVGGRQPIHKPRDIYSPERLSNGIKVQTRDFR